MLCAVEMVHASVDSKQKQGQCGPEAPAGGTLRAPARGGGVASSRDRTPWGEALSDTVCTVEGGRKAHSNWGATPT